jgi:hypothetical protein
MYIALNAALRSLSPSKKINKSLSLIRSPAVVGTRRVIAGGGWEDMEDHPTDIPAAIARPPHTPTTLVRSVPPRPQLRLPPNSLAHRPTGEFRSFRRIINIIIT